MLIFHDSQKNYTLGKVLLKVVSDFLFYKAVKVHFFKNSPNLSRKIAKNYSFPQIQPNFLLEKTLGSQWYQLLVYVAHAGVTRTLLWRMS